MNEIEKSKIRLIFDGLRNVRIVNAYLNHMPDKTISGAKPQQPKDKKIEAELKAYYAKLSKVIVEL